MGIPREDALGSLRISSRRPRRFCGPRPVCRGLFRGGARCSSVTLNLPLLARFPRRDAEAWDHVGLSVGDPDAKVRGVLCFLDATLDSLHAACSLGCNVLLTHHPVYISALTASVLHLLSVPRVPPSCTRPSGSVSVISLHTNLDRSHEARASLPGLLGMEAIFSRVPKRPGCDWFGKPVCL
ncbi:MAG: Nif3-like dinuclear metal center hexameric protein [Collinsella stercoris]|uniref:Nif3-like dinuclear metal center hexameric protein n=1 Tax=Collinsella stercoris TaxID=147206 RepID=UPI0039942BBA